jgi:hypothetical protein
MKYFLKKEISNGAPKLDSSYGFDADPDCNDGGADGFMPAATCNPVCFENFAYQVVPELHRHGRCRTVDTGSTLRANLLALREENA